MPVVGRRLGYPRQHQRCWRRVQRSIVFSEGSQGSQHTRLMLGMLVKQTRGVHGGLTGRDKSQPETLLGVQCPARRGAVPRNPGSACICASLMRSNKCVAGGLSLFPICAPRVYDLLGFFMQQLIESEFTSGSQLVFFDVHLSVSC